MSGTTNRAAAGGAAEGAPCPSTLSTLVQVQRWRAETHPDRPAFTFLRDGESDAVTLTYGDLDREASRLAGHLSRSGVAGEPVLLVFDPGVDYVTAFFACLYAGAVAVPVYPPDPFRLPRTLPRLQAIVENAGARWMLTTREMAERTRLGQVAGVELLVLDELRQEASPAPACHSGAADTMALLQYTSGSTGRPRGVIVSHGNLMHNFRAMHRMFDVENAAVAHWLPPYHDMGLIGCLLLPIYSGRHTVAMSPFAFMQKPIRWLQAIDRYRATTSGAPNFGYELCVRKVKSTDCEGLDLRSWQVAVTGAEPVRAGTLQAFQEKFASIGFRPETFLPAFGLAEATLIVSGEERSQPARVESLDAEFLQQGRVEKAATDRPRRRLVGCGRAAEDVEIRIVDPETRIGLGENAVGEIWLRSPGVGAGYWRDPQRTAECFQAAIANESDTRYLRTGDMGFLRDGELFVTGRRKELLIIGGRNLYPLDLEQAVQTAHPDLKPDGGAAFTIDVEDQEQLVLVQEVLRPKRHDLNELLRLASEALVAEAGVAPHAVLLISAGTLPKTSSGKTRRGECRRQYLEGGLRVLAQWPPPDSDTRPRGTPPSTDTQLKVAAIWEEVLGVEGVGLEDDFFLLGAKSLLIAAMLGRVSDWAGMEIPLSILFEHPALGAFAAAVDTARHSHSRQGGAERAEPTGPSPTEAPLTPPQQRFWFLEQLGSSAGTDGTSEDGAAGSLPSLHIPLEVHLAGTLDPAALRRRLQQIAERHDVWRASFELRESGPVMRLHGQAEVPWREADFRAGRDGYEGWRQRLVAEPMLLEDPPLARVGLARLGQEHWRLVVVMHHLIADGWTVGLLLRELGDGDLSVTGTAGYGAYAASQVEALRADSRDYWRRRLAGAPATLPLASGDRKARGGGSCAAELDSRLTGAITAFARRTRATPFMIYMAAFQAILSRYVASDDIVVGTVAANRRRPVWENVMGCFINTVPVRADLSGNPAFETFLHEIRSLVVEDLEHSDYPFEQLIEDLAPPREPGRLPLVQALLLTQEKMLDVPLHVAGAQVGAVEAGQAGLAEFDIALVIDPAGDAAAVTLHYHRRRLQPGVAARFLDTFIAVLEAVTDAPRMRLGELPIPSKPERLELLVDRNATDRLQQPSCPLAMLESAAGGPRTAVRCADQQLTYQQLHALANRVARRLQYLGVGPNVPVAVCMPRGVEMVAALLAVLKSGGAFVLLDPTHPTARRSAVLKDCRPRLLIQAGESSACEEASPSTPDAESQRTVTWERLVADAADELGSAPSQSSGEDDLAYLIYTSGTTGDPKGVMATRKGLANLLRSYLRSPGLSAADRLLAHTTASFDIAILELLLPLCAGAEIVLAPCLAGRDPHALIGLMQRHEVTFLQATPSAFRMLRDAGWKPSPCQTLLAGGEALSLELAEFLIAEGASLWNTYGPTETTIWSTLARVTAADLEGCRLQGRAPSIGRPIDNTQVYVLDDRRRPAPAGVAGELYIGGAGVARGYWRSEELTRQRFVADEFQDEPGHVLYRTGDRVRWRSDGDLEFLGRDDAQTKIRGFRVELGEVEAAMLRHSCVREAAAICLADGEEASLAGFVVWDRRTEVAALREFLAEELPHYMVPSTLTTLAEMPRSAAGKVDRRRLADAHAPAASSRSAPPTSPLELQVAAIWTEVLGNRDWGVEDRFFEFGGHSLKAIRMLSRIEAAYGVRLDVQAFFDEPTIGATAHRLLLALASESSELQELLQQVERLDEGGAASLKNHPTDTGGGPEGNAAP